jgi:hypothetical protein
MKNLSLIFLFFITTAIASAQTSDTLKTKFAKEWAIKGYEQFGVVDEPTKEQSNDKILLKLDNTCVIVENGKKYNGTWNFDKSKAYLQCNLGTIKRNYKIISASGKNAIIEYQSPDLIRTKYHLEAK